MIEEIISGGQSGVDLAAAQAAIEVGIPQGGYCPKGRTNENGTIPLVFNFEEVTFDHPYTEQENIDKRTIENIKHSDAVLIIVPTIDSLARINDGTKLTHIDVERQKKPVLHIALSDPQEKNTATIIAWIKSYKGRIKKLNVAGPRESTCPGIYELSLALFRKTFPQIKAKK